jgi:hypothetical protein
VDSWKKPSLCPEAEDHWPHTWILWLPHVIFRFRISVVFLRQLGAYCRIILTRAKYGSWLSHPNIFLFIYLFILTYTGREHADSPLDWMFFSAKQFSDRSRVQAFLPRQISW